MLFRITTLISITLYSLVSASGAQALRTIPNIPLAGIRGRITIDVFVGKKPVADPLAKVKLYLLKSEDSRRLEELQQRCRRITAQPKADPMSVYSTCSQSLAAAIELLPDLPAVASTETDRDGNYSFENVPAAGRYQVVGVKQGEGGEPMVMVGVTQKLKAGDRVTLNLSANDPWTHSTLAP